MPRSRFQLMASKVYTRHNKCRLPSHSRCPSPSPRYCRYRHIRIKHSHGIENRALSEIVDKRIHHHLHKPEKAAIHHAMTVSVRNSTFSFGAFDPSSMIPDPTSPKWPRSAVQEAAGETLPRCGGIGGGGDESNTPHDLLCAYGIYFFWC